MTAAKTFRKLPRYTWVREKTAFNTAKVFKDGVHHSTANVDTARDFCNKWNGVRGDWERKEH